MIDILDLTDSDAVRAVLAADEQEIPDEMMTAADLEGELTLDLSEWVPDSVSIEDVITDGESADQGSEEQLKYLRLSSYAKAFCALFFVVNQDMWRTIRLTDGNVDTRRRSDTDLEALARRLNEQLGKHRAGFLDLLDPDAVSTGFTPFSVSSPTYDPVTG